MRDALQTGHDASELESFCTDLDTNNNRTWRLPTEARIPDVLAVNATCEVYTGKGCVLILVCALLALSTASSYLFGSWAGTAVVEMIWYEVER
jgi:hypothetical protein